MFPVKGLNDPNYPHQLPSHSLSRPIPPVSFDPYSYPTHNHCTISAYGSTANPTSNRSASSQYSTCLNGAQWPVGKPTGPIFCPQSDVKRTIKTPAVHTNCAYELCRKLGCLDEEAVHHMNLSFLQVKESERSSTVRASAKELEYGQIAFSKPCFKINVESFPSSNVALFSPIISHPDDISANPSRSPLSSFISLLSSLSPASPFSTEQYFKEPRVISFMALNPSSS